jgi:methylated-DNA-[protein]-cysteine S-methyltransferase
MIKATVLDTPIGPLSLLTLDEDGTETLVASGFTSPEELYGRLSPELRRHELIEATELGPVARAHEAYFDGDLRALGSLPVHQVGSEKRLQLWAALREVPAGKTVSYGELASNAGLERAARAAGQACSQNLIAPAVPCHRVLPVSGSSPYGHYLYGVERKEWLLKHEATAAGR